MRRRTTPPINPTYPLVDDGTECASNEVGLKVKFCALIQKETVRQASFVRCLPQGILALWIFFSSVGSLKFCADIQVYD